MKKEDFKILLVDDNANIRDAITHILTFGGFNRLTALPDGKSAIERLSEKAFDLVITDYEMPGVMGDEVVRAALAADPKTAVLVISGSLIAEECETLASLGVRECLKKPFHVHELSGAIENAFQDLKEDLGKMADLAVLNKMAEASWSANGYSPEKQRRSLDKALNIGRQEDISLKELWNLELAFLVRDLGMAQVEKEILHKPSALNEEEFSCVRKHIEYSLEMAKPFVAEPAIRPIVQHHHERLDGKGYPAGLKGSQIHPLSRIIAVVDSYLAVTTNRPYRPALKKEEAIRELRRQQDARWESRLLEIMLSQPAAPA